MEEETKGVWLTTVLYLEFYLATQVALLDLGQSLFDQPEGVGQ